MRYFRVLVLMLVTSLLIVSPAWADDHPLQAGDTVYKMPYGDGQTLPLWTHVPEGISKDAPVMVVMHDSGRDAGRQLSQWRDISNHFGFYLLVPEFSEEKFPGPQHYSLGNMKSAAGEENPRADWSFSRIEAAFDHFKKQAGFKTNRYVLYGHSAGAQFVHRFMYFVTGSRVETFVAANANWYTMPDRLDNWPYGLRRTEVKVSRLKIALKQPLLILLAKQELANQHAAPPEAMAQGANRLQRGVTFYRLGRGQAEKLQSTFSWEIATVSGVAHDDRGMAISAANYLFAASQ